MSSMSFLGVWGFCQLCGVQRGVGAWEGDLSLVLEYLHSLVSFAKLKVSRYVPPSEGAWGGTEVRRGAW